MVWKAIKPIGKYGVGDIVPDGIAKVWYGMYAEQHVVEVIEEPKKPEMLKIEPQKESFDLNKDGVVDNKDKSLAGKVLSSNKVLPSKKQGRR